MADQFVVAFFGDGTLTVDAVGPFRSEFRARAAADRLADAIDTDDYDGFGDRLPSRLPHVVRLHTEIEAIQQFRRGDVDS